MAREGENVLILGIGNSLLTDDGFGIHVTRALEEKGGLGENITILDGGTLGLALLPDIEVADHLIVVDAAQMYEEAGHMKVLEGIDMDNHLSKHKSTVHEVAMVDLLSAVRLTGHEPKTRTLIAVQPENIEWGMEPTEKVKAQIDPACTKIHEIIERRLQNA